MANAVKRSPLPIIGLFHLRYDTRYLSNAQCDDFEKETMLLLWASEHFSDSAIVKIERYNSETDDEPDEDGYGFSKFATSSSRDSEAENVRLFRKFVSPLRRLQSEAKVNANGGER